MDLLKQTAKYTSTSIAEEFLKVIIIDIKNSAAIRVKVYLSVASKGPLLFRVKVNLGNSGTAIQLCWHFFSCNEVLQCRVRGLH